MIFSVKSFKAILMILVVACFSLALWAVPAVPGLAQEPPPAATPLPQTTGITPTTTLQPQAVSLTATTTTGLQTVATGPVNTLQLTLGELAGNINIGASGGGNRVDPTTSTSASNSVTAFGPGGQIDFEIRLPSHWQIQPDSNLNLQYITNIGAEDGANNGTMVVSLNGNDVFEQILDTPGQITVPIPLDEGWAEEDSYNRLRFAVDMNDVCPDVEFSYLRLFGDSLVTLNYVINSPRLDLARYPIPIYERTIFPSYSYLVMPSTPNPLEIESSLAVVAGLGDLSNDRLNITTTLDTMITSTTAITDHIIAVGAIENNQYIMALNDTVDLPAPLIERQLSITTTGPDLIQPETRLTYTVQVSNSQSVTQTGLSIHSRLPYIIEDVECEPGCVITNGEIIWNVDSLPPLEVSDYRVSFSTPPTFTLENAEFSSELFRDEAVINVSTLSSPIALEGTPTLTSTQPASGYFFSFNGRAVPETDGVIQLLPSPAQPEKAILLVTGLTEEAVLKAGQALGSQLYFPGFKGQVALVQDVIDPPVTDENPGLTLTLADLGVEDVQVISGVGKFQTTYRFPLPLNATLSEDAKVNFIFGHSALANPANSSLTLQFNRTPIASTSLDDSNIVDGQLSGRLPYQSTRPGEENTFLVNVQLDSGYPCTDSETPHIWFSYDPESSIYIPYFIHDQSYLDLVDYPLPFSDKPNLDNLVVSLPEQPSITDYNVAVKLISQLGTTGNGTTFKPEVVLGDVTDRVDMANHHVLVVGLPSQSTVMQQINPLLPQPFVPGTDDIQQTVQNVIFRFPEDLNLGYLQLLPSPWSENFGLLAATGTSDAGLALVPQAFSSRLKGNLVLVQEESVESIDTRKLTREGEAAALATAVPGIEAVTPTPELVQPTAVVTQPLEGDSATDTTNQQPAAPAVDQQLPVWFPFAIGGGIILIVGVLLIAYWQSRRKKRSDF